MIHKLDFGEMHPKAISEQFATYAPFSRKRILEKSKSKQTISSHTANSQLNQFEKSDLLFRVVVGIS